MVCRVHIYEPFSIYNVDTRLNIFTQLGLYVFVQLVKLHCLSRDSRLGIKIKTFQGGIRIIEEATVRREEGVQEMFMKSLHSGVWPQVIFLKENLESRIKIISITTSIKYKVTRECIKL